MADPTTKSEQEYHTLDDLNALEKEMERVRLLFEQYFGGVERIPPLTQRDALLRRVRRFRVNKGDTILRFRHENLRARMVVLQTHWSRIMRQIEDGRYKRDRFKANLHAKHRKRDTDKSEADRSEARSEATAVADEASAFLEQLGAPKVGMRGNAKRGEEPSVPMRGRPTSGPPPAQPPPARPVPTQPVGGQPAPRLPMRGRPASTPPGAQPPPDRPASRPPPGQPAAPLLGRPRTTDDAPAVPMRGSRPSRPPAPASRPSSPPPASPPIPLRGQPKRSED
jgi:hypothetical protein